MESDSIENTVIDSVVNCEQDSGDYDYFLQLAIKLRETLFAFDCDSCMKCNQKMDLMDW